MPRERDIQAHLRHAASLQGWRLWRNNVGAVHTADGRFLRFGLCNESEAMNRDIKSSDLIGIRPLQIGPLTIGQFVAVEVKAPGRSLHPAQEKFLELVRSLGGHAIVSTGEL